MPSSGVSRTTCRANRGNEDDRDCSPITTNGHVLATNPIRLQFRQRIGTKRRGRRRIVDRHLSRAGWPIDRVGEGRARPTECPPEHCFQFARLEIGPGRSSRGTGVVRSRTVDSRPRAVGPLSMIRSMRPSRSASTWSARVGESRFARFALGAAIGWPGPFDQAECNLSRREHARRRCR